MVPHLTGVVVSGAGHLTEDVCWKVACPTTMTLMDDCTLMFGSGSRRVKADAGLAMPYFLARKNASTGGYPENALQCSTHFSFARWQALAPMVSELVLGQDGNHGGPPFKINRQSLRGSLTSTWEEPSQRLHGLDSVETMDQT